MSEVSKRTTYHICMNKHLTGLLLSLLVVKSSLAQSTLRVVVVTSDGQITQAALTGNVVVDFSTTPPTLKAVVATIIDQRVNQNAATGDYTLPSGAVASSKVVVYRNGIRQAEGKNWERVGNLVKPKAEAGWTATDEVTVDVFPR